MSVVERTPLKLTRESEPEGELIEIPDITSKNMLAFVQTLAESDPIQAAYRDGTARMGRVVIGRACVTATVRATPSRCLKSWQPFHRDLPRAHTHAPSSF